MSTSHLFEQALTQHRAGRTHDARALYGQVLVADPHHHQALAHLSLLALQGDDPASAAQLLERALEIAPAVFDYLVNLGVARRKLKQLEKAAEAFTQATVVARHRPESYFNLGLTLQDLKESDLARQAFEAATTRAPDNVIIRKALASFLAQRGEVGPALEHWERVVALDPSSGHLIEWGTLLRRVGQHEQAILILERAKRLAPKSPVALAELAAAMTEVERLDDAEDGLRQALELAPSDPGALFNLATTLMLLGRIEESAATLRTFIAVRPEHAQARSNLVLLLNYHPTVTAEEILAEARSSGSGHAPSFGSSFPQTAEPERPLRIGYWSGNFGSLGVFLPHVLESHDRERYEIFCYSGQDLDEPLASRLRSASEFRAVGHLSDAALADTIRADRIDVLVDLTMHMAGSRLGALAAKPAPVQMAWLAYPGTTGLPSIDYRLTDRYLDPPGATLPYSESTLWLRDSFWPYEPGLGDVEPGALPALENGFVTFGSLNAFAKVHEGLLEVWGRILRATPNSRLLMLSPPGRSRERVLSVLAKHQVDRSRIEFVRKQARRAYFETYHRIDICLDTFPCGGHTTGLDALWMGVPVVTLVGNRVAGRAGFSQAENIGFGDLIAHTEDEYVAKAVGLAASSEHLATLRNGLRARLEGSPIMDGARFARSLEQVYREGFARWCAQRG